MSVKVKARGGVLVKEDGEVIAKALPGPRRRQQLGYSMLRYLELRSICGGRGLLSIAAWRHQVWYRFRSVEFWEQHLFCGQIPLGVMVVYGRPQGCMCFFDISCRGAKTGKAERLP